MLAVILRPVQTHDLMNQKSCISQFSIKMHNFCKLLVPNPKNWSKSSLGNLNLSQKVTSESSILKEKTVQQALKFDAKSFLFMPLPIPKPKLSTQPPGHGSKKWENFDFLDKEIHKK